MIEKPGNSNLTDLLAKERREAQEREAQRRAAQFKCSYINLATVPIQTNALRLINGREAKQAQMAIFQVKKKQLKLAVFDPTTPSAKKIVAKLKLEGYELEIFAVSLPSLIYAWSFYQFVTPEAKEITSKIEIAASRIKELTQKLSDLKKLKAELQNFKKPSISQIFEIILAGALVNRASDIHFEPSRAKTKLRLRIDGLLYDAYDLLPNVYLTLVSRIKLLSKLKLNIHDQAQDGRFTIGLEDKDIEIRTSVIPSEFGETIVLRILDPALIRVDFEKLGLRKDDLEIVGKELRRPNGMILNTGPTGSGKTTTLYAFLRKIYQPEIKVVTIEDPIEYHLEGIEQTQVNPKAGYDFSNGLRSILRQDPDVILVGEIRDLETAQIAIHAALTGHLVFSTLHTNEATGAIPRLIDLGVQPSVISPAINLIIAQRLVRQLCPVCKKEKKIDEQLIKKLKKFISQLPSRVERDELNNLKIFEAPGCQWCGGLGYRERIGIFEVFLITPEVMKAMAEKVTDLELQELARQQQMITMQQDGLIKILLGLTTFEEVERVTGPLIL
jgi:type II secretory ATPase GspE/PulE/Tfp pilus assembly ATPase PilB-like protein